MSNFVLVLFIVRIHSETVLLDEPTSGMVSTGEEPITIEA